MPQRHLDQQQHRRAHGGGQGAKQHNGCAQHPASHHPLLAGEAPAAGACQQHHIPVPMPDADLKAPVKRMGGWVDGLVQFSPYWATDRPHTGLKSYSNCQHSLLKTASNISVLRTDWQVILYIAIFEACLVFIHVAACRCAKTHHDPLHQWHGQFWYHHDCSNYFRRSQRATVEIRTH